MSLPHRRFRAEHLSNFVEKVVKPFRKASLANLEQLRNCRCNKHSKHLRIWLPLSQEWQELRLQ